jgi:hypothetical protein
MLAFGAVVAAGNFPLNRGPRHPNPSAGAHASVIAAISQIRREKCAAYAVKFERNTPSSA